MSSTPVPCDAPAVAPSAAAEIIPSAAAEILRGQVVYVVEFDETLPRYTVTPTIEGEKIGRLRCRALPYLGALDGSAPRLWYPISTVLRREFRGEGIGAELYRAAISVCPGILTPSESLSTGAERVWASIVEEGAGAGVVAVESPWGRGAGGWSITRRREQARKAREGGAEEAGGAQSWVWGVQGGSVAPRGEVVLRG